MKHLLMLLMLAVSCSVGAQQIKFFSPKENPAKTFPPGYIHNGPSGNLNAVLIIPSATDNLRFIGAGMEDENVEYDREEQIYIVQVFEGTGSIYVNTGDNSFYAFHPENGFESGKCYSVDLTGHSEPSRMTVNTDPGANIYVDGLLMTTAPSTGVSPLNITPGKHSIYADKTYDAYTGSRGYPYEGEARTYRSAEKSVDVGKSGNIKSVDLPVTGEINLRPHAKHEGDKIAVTLAVDRKAEEKAAAAKDYVPATMPDESDYSLFGSNMPVTGLRGNYVATYSANGYHTKTSRYSVAPGQRVDAEIKLDPIHGRTFIEYQFSPNGMFGLNVGHCGKFAGFFISGGFVGINDPGLKKDSDPEYSDRTGLSYYFSAGPMFRILRSLPNLYLSLGGGYGKVFYDADNYMSHCGSWLVTAKLNFRFKKAFTFGVGYNYYLRDFRGPGEKSGDLNNLVISIGAAF